MDKKEIHLLCQIYGISHYSILDDLSVNAYCDVDISQYNLTQIPFKFNKVRGNFNCSGNLLTNLFNCPNEVGGYFSCHDNRIKDLTYYPDSIDGRFYSDYLDMDGLKHDVVELYVHNNYNNWVRNKKRSKSIKKILG